MKKIILLLTLVFLSCKKEIKLDNKYCLINEEAAIKLAEIEWYNVYGKSIYYEQPFVAELKNDSVWVVKGTLHYESGGTLYIEINAKDCDVIKMSHGK